MSVCAAISEQQSGDNMEQKPKPGLWDTLQTGPQNVDQLAASGKRTGTAEKKKPDPRLEVMELAMDAGRLLLENGAETARVTETMQRISRHYGLQSARFFVLSNGILASCGSEDEPLFSRVEHIPVNSGRLDWVCAVNQLSREIEHGDYTVRQAREAVRQVRRMPGKRVRSRILFGAVATAAFSLMFGGNWSDCLASFFAGLVVQVFQSYVSGRHLSRIVGTIAGGAVTTCCCLLLHLAGLGDNLNVMIMSTVMLLVPGVPFVNGIRDIAAGDYLSGAIRLIDAILGFACIAIGVAVCFILYHRVFGGSIL